MSGPITPPQPVSYSQAVIAALNAQDAQSTPAAAPAQQPAMARDGVRTSAAAGRMSAAVVDLTSPQVADTATAMAAAQNTAPELFVNEQNRIVTADGQPYMNTEMYLGENDQIVDAQGKSIDLVALEGQPGAPTGGAQAPSAADLKVMKRVKMGTAAASGALGIGMDYMWYRSTLGGMERRLNSLQTASKAFKNGTGVQAKLQNTPVLGTVVTKLQNRREGKVGPLQRSIKIARMTPGQEGKFLAKERLTALRSESKAFAKGQSMMGRIKDTPVVGSLAKGVENRRQSTITRLQAEMKATQSQAGTWTKVKNATRGRIFPTIMLASDGYSVYQGIKGLKAPGNTRKVDDYLRIGGNAVSATGDIMAFRRGHIGNAIATHAAGMVISTLGTMLNDQD
ncbi:MAG: hypothetical protein H7338_17090 [Candidatus Sericytochromatia bacterium]|nr:hypothetical protein [Candidatus Sericytochromatia bacterium]